MKKYIRASSWLLVLAVLVVPGATEDSGIHATPASNPLTTWQIMGYFGGDDWVRLPWYYQWGVGSGVTVACSFIGFGVGTLNPLVGALVGGGCDIGFMA